MKTVEEIRDYIQKGIDTFVVDPPHDAPQAGYLDALIHIREFITGEPAVFPTLPKRGAHLRLVEEEPAR